MAALLEQPVLVSLLVGLLRLVFSAVLALKKKDGRI